MRLVNELIAGMYLIFEDDYHPAYILQLTARVGRGLVTTTTAHMNSHTGAAKPPLRIGAKGGKPNPVN
jgi:hypothetical protein